MTSNDSKLRHAALLVVSGGAVLASFLWQGRAGLNLADEGYLWYGVQRVLLGEVPIRDFGAYDPGRYYWSAALLRAAGEDGIVALRVSVALAQVAGLYAGLWTVLRSAPARSSLYLLPVAATLLAWMFPRHKLFDAAISLLLVATIAALIERPTRGRYLLAGAAVGLAAFFGRNHGVYGVAGSLAAMAFLALRRPERDSVLRGAGAWAMGVVLGYSPLLLMLAAVPGFASAFWDSVRFLLERGAENIPLPVPWPWNVDYARLDWSSGARQLIVGLLFLAVPAFGIAGCAGCAIQRLRHRAVPPVVLASAIMALPYAHYAYSRADVGHLALGIFPFLIGTSALIARMRAALAWPLAIALATISLFTMLPYHPGGRCEIAQCVEADVGRSRLRVEPAVARDLDLLRELVAAHAPGDRTFFVAPFWPGAYAAFGRKAPVLETYPLLPRGPRAQGEEIELLQLARPGFVVILDHALDGREERRFRNTHPMIDRHVREHFELLRGYTADPMYRIYRAK